MSDEAAAAIERFRLAQDRRADERDLYREQLTRCSSLREYIDLQNAHGSAPPQATANLGHSHMKKRR